jgi:lipopolysaccharide/colanic/teichoic acid biosynthesis glycosyltransferase
MIKRGFDLAAASIGLILASPVFLAVAALVAVRMGPPVFFSQPRVGKNGRKFKLVKFRTMSVSSGAEKGAFEPGNLARVTPLGKFLRKTKLDEWPQLLNVIRGEMSLVGPRPEVPRWVEAYPEKWAIVHSIRPGITDPAALIYRREEELLSGSPDPEQTYRDVILPHKLALYEDYIKNRSFFLDVKIIVKTGLALFKP